MSYDDYDYDYFDPDYHPRIPMKFDNLNPSDKARYAKQEFHNIIRAIFENPESLKLFISEKKLSVAQSKAVIKSLNKLNAKQCACCRTFDPAKLQLPIPKELDPIIDIAHINVRTRNY